MGDWRISKITKKDDEGIYSLEIENGKDISFMLDSGRIIDCTIDELAMAHSMLQDLDEANVLFDNRFKNKDSE